MPTTDAQTDFWFAHLKAGQAEILRQYDVKARLGFRYSGMVSKRPVELSDDELRAKASQIVADQAAFAVSPKGRFFAALDAVNTTDMFVIAQLEGLRSAASRDWNANAEQCWRGLADIVGAAQAEAA